MESISEFNSNPTQNPDNSATHSTETLTAESIEQLQESVQKLKRYRELQQEYKQLRAEVQFSDREALSFRHRSQSSSSSDTRDKGEIKIKNIPIFTLDFNLQQWQEWLLDLRHTFLGAPKKFRTESRKILAALSYMQSTCRQRWYRHTTEKPQEQQREAEESWHYFSNWTLGLIHNAATL
jgi:predicted RNase H-like nuclease (RuvC/YqgF family)